MNRRYGIVAGFESPALRALMVAQADEERAEMQLLSVLAAGLDNETVTAEVDRRETLFSEARRRSPRSHAETPRAAALRSVAADIARGHII